MTPSLGALTCPVLIVAGDTSAVLTPSILEGVHQLNPRISSVVLPGGHLLPLESPKQCAEQALAFIEAHDKEL
jgi:pimeloyl-ACP methyl ester carboxylesterase